MSRDVEDVFGCHASASDLRRINADWYGEYHVSVADHREWEMQQRFIELRREGYPRDEAEAIVAEEFDDNEEESDD